MSRIKIKNFGPIKEGLLENNGWIDIKKVTMFIGNQGSGKSTVAKLISTFMWMEKAILNGKISELTIDDFVFEYCKYFRLENYFQSDTEIEYEGVYQRISYKKSYIARQPTNHSGVYKIPKIMYVPAERSFLSSVEGADRVSGLPKPLVTFMVEFNRSLDEIDNVLMLPFGNYRLAYDKSRKTSFIVGDDYKLELTAAASGLHSAVPLFVVSRNLSSMLASGKSDQSLSDLDSRQLRRRTAELRMIRTDFILNDTDIDEQKLKELESVVESKYRNSLFINIVEEPEQNLFPTAQKEILYSLLEFNNMLPGNKLIMTTHSPYLINDLTLSIEANNLLQKIKDAGREDSLNEMVYKIVPKDSTVNGKDVAIYEMDESNGTISLLGNYKGLPSDENKLNDELGQSNDKFVELLEIEDKIKPKSSSQSNKRTK